MFEANDPLACFDVFGLWSTALLLCDGNDTLFKSLVLI